MGLCPEHVPERQAEEGAPADAKELAPWHRAGRGEGVRPVAIEATSAEEPGTGPRLANSPLVPGAARREEASMGGAISPANEPSRPRPP